MNIRITFRGMESSPALEKYIAGCNQKLERFLKAERDPVQLEIVLEAQPIHAQFAIELRLHAANNHIRVTKNGTDLYGAIDGAFDVLLRDIRKEKEKEVTKRKGRVITKRKIT